MPKTEEKLLQAPAEHKLLAAPDGRNGAGQRHDEKEKSGPARRTIILIAAGLLLLLALLFLFGYWRHHRVQQEAAAAAEKQREQIPAVNVTKVHRAPSTSELLLPGNITPLTEAYLYARASGYVKKRYVDIGDKVVKGQLLAEIEAPDLDEQVAQARAAVAQAEHQLEQTNSALANARSQLDLQKITWDRYKVLVSHGAIARQDADNQFTAYQSAQANVASAQQNVSAAEQNVRANQANLNRLIALQGYEFVRAPFTGIITARNFDVGALINGGGSSSGASSTPSGGTQSSASAGNSGTAGTGSLVTGSSSSPSGGQTAGGGVGELFREAQIGTLRILINVPQENAPTVHPGQAATVLVEQFANRPFHGRLTRTSSSVDPNTRTLLAEVDVDNPKNVLLPGMYAQVEIQDKVSSPPLLAPGDSIITDASGLHVAILEDLKQDNQKDGKKYPEGAKRIHVQPVRVGRDYGQQVEIIRGLQGWEYVVVNPTDDVQEGAVVKPAAAPKAAGEGSPQRRSPSEQQPTGISPEQPGMVDTGGKGASQKGAASGGGGQKGGGQSNGGGGKQK